MDLNLIEKAVDLLLSSDHAVVLTGAGISTESGVPDFRSPGGIWETFDPAIFFYDRFLAHPQEVWDAILKMHGSDDVTLWDAKPNKGHSALAYMEKTGIVKSVITQNVDDLHQKAGSKTVIEFHGNMLHARCLSCSRVFTHKNILRMMRRNSRIVCPCGGIIKPEVVFFGETIPREALIESSREAGICDLMLVIGTSAQVEPAASLPLIAKGKTSLALGMDNIPLDKQNCTIIEINKEPTPLTDSVSDFLILGSAGEALSRIEACIRHRRRHI